MSAYCEDCARVESASGEAPLDKERRCFGCKKPIMRARTKARRIFCCPKCHERFYGRLP